MKCDTDRTFSTRKHKNFSLKKEATTKTLTGVEKEIGAGLPGSGRDRKALRGAEPGEREDRGPRQ